MWASRSLQIQPGVMPARSHAGQESCQAGVMPGRNHAQRGVMPSQESCQPGVMQARSHASQESCQPGAMPSRSHASQEPCQPGVMLFRSHAARSRYQGTRRTPGAILKTYTGNILKPSSGHPAPMLRYPLCKKRGNGIMSGLQRQSKSGWPWAARQG